MTQASAPFFYDLSEIFYAAAGRRKFYGVLRVIAEFGRELQRMDRGIRFVVYSPGHRRFAEVHPDFSRLCDQDSLDIGLPATAAPRLLRSVFHRHHLARRIAYAMAAPLVGAINRARWRNGAMANAWVDLNGATLCSAARPKFLVEYLAALRRGGARLVPMLHDLIPLHEVVQSSRSVNFCGDTAAVLRSAAGVIANSASTCSEIWRFAAQGRLPAPKSMTTVRLAHQIRASSAAAARALPGAPYLLCVGSALGRKNLDVVFEALALLCQSGARADCALVLAGAPDRLVREHLARPALRQVAARVICFDHPDHAELLALYRHALCVIVPSRREGWGLPAGEALWLGTPLICANSPALLEASAGLALVFDPDSAAELAALIERLLGDPAFHSAQAATIRAARATLRSWEQAAAELFDATLACVGAPARALHNA